MQLYFLVSEVNARRTKDLETSFENKITTFEKIPLYV